MHVYILPSLAIKSMNNWDRKKHKYPDYNHMTIITWLWSHDYDHMTMITWLWSPDYDHLTMITWVRSHVWYFAEERWSAKLRGGAYPKPRQSLLTGLRYDWVQEEIAGLQSHNGYSQDCLKLPPSGRVPSQHPWLAVLKVLVCLTKQQDIITPFSKLHKLTNNA